MLGGPLPAEGVAPSEVVEQLARDAARRARRLARAALLRLRHRRRAAGRARRRLARLGVGPERVQRRLLAGRVGGGGDRVRLAARRARAAAPTAASGLTTGAQMANVTGLAAARHALLARAGWDLEEQGLDGSPPLRVFAGAEAHVTVWRALRLLGIGRAQVEVVPADDQGAMRADALRPRRPRDRLRAGRQRQQRRVRPARGDRRRGARARRVGARRRRVRAVGGGLARRSSHLTAGAADADSWATDGHKWLNVPYDCGVVAVRDREAHAAAMGMSAAYLIRDAPRARTPTGCPRRRDAAAGSPSTRRCARSAARGWPSWSSATARSRGGWRSAVGGEVEVLNDVVLNQVLLGFEDDVHRRACRPTACCWAGGTRLARPPGDARLGLELVDHARPTSTAAPTRSSAPCKRAA